MYIMQLDQLVIDVLSYDCRQSIGNNRLLPKSKAYE